MRKAKQITAESQPRIDKTKQLNLDERVQILTDAINTLGISQWNSEQHSEQLANWLTEHGYEPMMFTLPFRVWLSRNRTKGARNGN